MATEFWARIDSNTANNPATNLTPAAAVQFEFVPASGGSGDLILDQPAAGVVDPDTQVVLNGVTYDFVFEFVGELPTLKKNGAQQVPDEFEGESAYLITIQDYPTSGESTRIMFMPGAGATEADMNAFGNGGIDIQALDTSPPPTVLCFGGGTMIATPRGEVAVQDLRVGDMVTTLDDGPSRILWISATHMEWPDANPKELPVLIGQGALGSGLPTRDLIVSPQHRMLLTGRDIRQVFGVDQAFAPAKGLTQLPGVRVMQGKKQVQYFHIVLQRHSVLIANGTASESFYPGTEALKNLKATQMLHLLSLFPGLAEDVLGAYGPIARKSLTVRQAIALTEVGGLKVEPVGAKKVSDMVQQAPLSVVA